jgi:hypothetical protein
VVSATWQRGGASVSRRHAEAALPRDEPVTMATRSMLCAFTFM